MECNKGFHGFFLDPHQATVEHLVAYAANLSIRIVPECGSKEREAGRSRGIKLWVFVQPLFFC